MSQFPTASLLNWNPHHYCHQSILADDTALHIFATAFRFTSLGRKKTAFSCALLDNICRWFQNVFAANKSGISNGIKFRWIELLTLLAWETRACLQTTSTRVQRVVVQSRAVGLF